jgi:hypothetical protein
LRVHVWEANRIQMKKWSNVHSYVRMYICMYVLKLMKKSHVVTSARRYKVRQRLKILVAKQIQFISKQIVIFAENWSKSPINGSKSPKNWSKSPKWVKIA